jgi:hypothetical protein
MYDGAPSSSNDETFVSAARDTKTRCRSAAAVTAGEQRKRIDKKSTEQWPSVQLVAIVFHSASSSASSKPAVVN